MQVSANFIIRVQIDDETYVNGGVAHAMVLTVGFADYPVSADADHPTIVFNFDVLV